MVDDEARRDAIRQGATFQRPEVEAIGLVFAEVWRPFTLEPFPWPVVDALRAIDAANRARAREDQPIAPRDDQDRAANGASEAGSAPPAA